jgi:hypothetical protein
VLESKVIDMQWNDRNWRNTVAVASLAVCAGALPAQQFRPVLLIAAAVSPAVPSEGAADPSAKDGGDPQHDDLFDGLEKLGANAKEKNEVNLDKNMMGLVSGRKGGRYADISSKIDLITVRSYEFSGKDMYSKKDLETLRRRTEGNGWSHLVRNESDGEINDIVVKSDGDGFISDMVIVNAESKELNIVHLKGHFRMEDVNGAMSSAMSVSMGAGAGAMGMAMGALHGSSRHNTQSPASPASPQPPQPPQH